MNLAIVGEVILVFHWGSLVAAALAVGWEEVTLNASHEPLTRRFRRMVSISHLGGFGVFFARLHPVELRGHRLAVRIEDRLHFGTHLLKRVLKAAIFSRSVPTG